ncbi:MAG: hypothetical protein BWY54_00367 [Candidatus Dependentiae bacterium ADurb.Bin331]|nr:MAG: hypothetical protein BWY54_00367 [Candidatus Dependentiae bacterium ADurb.Bin331]
MVKKIGNALFALLLIASCHAQETKISLDVLDQHGRPTSEVGIGVPFLIEATISGDEQMNAPVIDRLKLMHIEDQGLVSTIRTTINGVSSNKKVYRYVVRADKTGSFTLGPARLQTKNGEISSHAISVTVSATPKTNSNDEALVRLYADKDQVFVGEKVSFVVRFYYQKGVSLIGISEPQLPGAQPLQGPFSGTEIVDGQRMNYLEWRSIYFPTKIGTLTIPAVRAAFKIPRTQQTHAFDFISSFFDSGFEQKYVYSNGLSMVVDALPENRENVTAIGTFDHFELTLDRSQARQGDGIVLTLSVEGEGNFDTMMTPVLTVPDGLTYYDSKSTVQEIGNNRQKKSWEYIVQGTRPGSITLLSQTFSYFDVMGKEYKKLTTKPVSLTIVALDNPVKQTSADQLHVAAIAHNQNELPTTTQMQHKMPLMLNGDINAQELWHIDWWIFWLCCAVIASLLLGAAGISWYKKYTIANAPHNDYAYAFKVARNQLMQAKKNNLVHRALYDIFILLFAKRAQCTLNEMNEERMVKQLSTGGCPPHLKTQWEDFFRRCSEHAFFKHEDESNYTQLYQEAEQWLLRLRDYI